MSVRTFTNARHVGVRLQSICTGTHRHARVDASNTIEKRGTSRNMGTSSYPSVGRTVEREDQHELETREQKKKADDAKRIRGIFSRK